MYTIPEHIKKQAKEIIAQYTPENQPLGFWMFDIQQVLNAFERIFIHTMRKIDLCGIPMRKNRGYKKKIPHRLFLVTFLRINYF